jgi:hypothetical protein
MLPGPQQNLIIKTGKVCKEVLELQGVIEQIDILYNGSPNWDEIMTDEEIQEVPLFAEMGITAQTVADGIYQLSQLKQLVLTGNLPALVLLAQLG